MSNKLEYVIKNSATKKPRTKWLHCKILPDILEELTVIILKLLEKYMRQFFPMIWEVSIILIKKKKQSMTHRHTQTYTKIIQAGILDEYNAKVLNKILTLKY